MKKEFFFFKEFKELQIMKHSQKIDILNKILSLGLFFILIPITIIYLLTRDISNLSTYYNFYFTSGKSLFFPFLPYYNILWFLPEQDQLIQFSTGHLIDVIIIMNIVAFVERSGYHYYVKICLKENYQEPFMLGSEEHPFNLTQEQDIFFGLREDSRFIFEEGFLNIKFKKKQRLTDKTEVFHEYMTKEVYRCRIFERGILLQKSSRFRNKGSQVFCFHSGINKFSDTLLINQTLYPQICYIYDSTKPIKQEG